MTRFLFGGGIADWVFEPNVDDVPVLQGGVVVTFWSEQSGGVQYTDLLNVASSAITSVTTNDGTGGTNIGELPLFYGPDDILGMWASADGGPRLFISTYQLASLVDTNTDLIVATSAQLTAHISSLNPHATRMDDLVDVDGSSVADGQVLVYSLSTQTWVPASIPGLSGVMDLASDQTVTGQKTFNPSNTSKVRLILIAVTGQLVDTFQVFGSGGVKTFSLTNNGDARVKSSSASGIPFRVSGAAGQTGNLFEATNDAGTVLAWVDSVGRLRAPNAGRTWPLYFPSGAAATGTGKHRIYNDTGQSLTIRQVRASVGTAPTGSSLIVDVNKGGTTVFTTQANRPTITAGSFTATASAIDVTTLAAGDYLTVDVDQVGSTTPGSDLTIQIELY